MAAHSNLHSLQEVNMAGVEDNSTKIPCDLQPSLSDEITEGIFKQEDIPSGFEDIKPNTSLSVRLALVGNYSESEGGSYKQYLKLAGLREYLCPHCRRTHYTIQVPDPNRDEPSDAE
jgi:hypothetical protein